MTLPKTEADQFHPDSKKLCQLYFWELEEIAVSPCSAGEVHKDVLPREGPNLVEKEG